jgi:hypothetical protein
MDDDRNDEQKQKDEERRMWEEFLRERARDKANDALAEIAQYRQEKMR